jgi:hypothetical protein
LHKKLIGIPIGLVDLADLAEIDEDRMNGLLALRELEDVAAAGLSFVVTVESFGAPKDVPLKEGGDDIPVTKSRGVHSARLGVLS